MSNTIRTRRFGDDRSGHVVARFKLALSSVVYYGPGREFETVDGARAEAKRLVREKVRKFHSRPTTP